MKRTTLIAAISVAVIALTILAVGLRTTSDRQIAASIASFEDCSKAGYPVLEMYPAQCKTPDGRTFTELIAAEPATTTNATSSPAASTSSADIEVTSPQAGEAISNPVVIKGKARGSWFFEADFPIEIHAASSGDPDLSPLLGSGYATAQGNWMTNDFVPFTATVAFDRPDAGVKDGFIVLIKNNPSGLPQNDEEIHIPVKFANGAAAAACYVGGCSGEVCSGQKDAVSNCIYKPEFVCYKESFARCERQANGQCGWSESTELKQCLSSAQTSEQHAQ